LSNLLKARETHEIPVQAYAMKEVKKGKLPARPAMAATFRKLNEPERLNENLSEARLKAETEEKDREREKLDRLEKETYEKAFALGEKAGMESGERMFQSAVRTFMEAAEGLKRIQREFYQQFEGEILDLVMATTRKVVQKEVDSEKDTVLGILKEAIGKTIDRENIRVKINPSDYDFIHGHKPEIIQANDGIKQLIIEKDESVSRGGAIVETDYGTIDASIDRRLNEVEKNMRRQLGSMDTAINNA